ncbi:hypothetical protein I4U23_010687 [Adineta vaga]|nr:hypothetical protein I4U23_010687 [Adineta vaga]
MTGFGVNAKKITIRTLKGLRSLIKPYLIATVAIGTSVTTGDLICQYIESHKKNRKGVITITPSSPSSSSPLSWWDRKRSRVMCTAAVFVSTPWSFTLSRIVERLFPGTQNIQIVKKILTNTLFAPIGISLMFTSVILLNGHTFREVKRKVKNDMPKTFLAGTCYWPLVSFLNFRFIPLDYRPIAGSLAGAIWNVYVSSAANNPKLNPDGSIQIPAGPAPTLLAESGGSAVPALQEAWRTLDDDNKKKDR